MNRSRRMRPPKSKSSSKAACRKSIPKRLASLPMSCSRSARPCAVLANCAVRGTRIFAVTQKEELTSITFMADNLRDFAIVAGQDLRSEQRSVGDVTIRSIFKPEHEVVARRVLNIATDAVRIYSARLGPLPMKTVSLVDAPLVATLGTAEFAGLGVIASAFYLDFDSPTMRNMPDVIREQRGSVEGSLEWTVAHVVAHQWWGITVGNDPAREPILDEALANWSALLYYRETHGEPQ